MKHHIRQLCSVAVLATASAANAQTPVQAVSYQCQFDWGCYMLGIAQQSECTSNATTFQLDVASADKIIVDGRELDAQVFESMAPDGGTLTHIHVSFENLAQSLTIFPNSAASRSIHTLIDGVAGIQSDFGTCKAEAS